MLSLDLTDLITWALESYQLEGQTAKLENKDVEQQLISYILDRFRARYEDEGVSIDVFLSVNARRPTQPLDLGAEVMPLFDKGDYQSALSLLAGLQATVDQFFEDVMVMADDLAVRKNRLVLLKLLSDLFLRAADISLLSK